ncbi:MAG: type II toxin-antitoxin system MqsA family antitoxin [Pseudohongiella sp.]|nr:type II toxin-antitoxin system MqsA family antitoxin [Pseudohongiella sp.]
MKTISDKVICGICGNGHLDSRVKKHVVEYRATQNLLEVEYSICDGCGSEQAAGNQLRNNKRAMIRLKKSVDGLLTGKEVRAIRERLNLSQADAARVFGGGPVAFSKYESDDVTQSEAMDKMIRLAGDLPTAFEYLVRQAGITHASAR